MAHARARAKARKLRSRVIYHAKKGNPARRLRKAYARAKAALRRATKRHRKVYTRAQWGAARPRGDYSNVGRVVRVIVHHTAFNTKNRPLNTLSEECAHMREIQQWHFNRGFIDVGYHFIVAPSGRIFQGRPTHALGAHVSNWNTGSIGISLMGNFEQETPTRQALASLHVLLRKYPRVTVKGHRDMAGHTTNACPGKYLHKHL